MLGASEIPQSNIISFCKFITEYSGKLQTNKNTICTEKKFHWQCPATISFMAYWHFHCIYWWKLVPKGWGYQPRLCGNLLLMIIRSILKLGVIYCTLKIQSNCDLVLFVIFLIKHPRDLEWRRKLLPFIFVIIAGYVCAAPWC